MLTEIVRALVQSGATPEMILAAVEAAEARLLAKEEERLAKQRERTRKSRAKRAPSPDVTLHHVTERDSPLEKKVSPDPFKETQPPSTPASLRDAAPTPRSELAAVLDETHAVAVVEHRQRLRKPLTAHAAHLLAGKLAKFPDPNAAADTMIVKGWQTIEPDWPGATNTGPPRNGHTRPLSGSEEMVRVCKQYSGSSNQPAPDEDSFAGKTIETGDYRRVG